MSKIIDISHHQLPSRINYDKLAKQLDWAIIRTQYGSRLIDRHYQTHHAELRKRGVPTAAYAWVRGVSINDMEVEATDFYNRTKDINPTFWFLDVEEKSMSDMRGGVKAYIEKLRSLGAGKVGVYIGHHLFKSFNLDLSDVDAVWIPHYGSNNGTVNSNPSYDCDLHQYTSTGRLDGYKGNLDLNRIISDKKLSYFTGKGAKENLKIDGYLGPKTISALQRYFGTIVDGVISRPSLVVKALQEWLSVKQDGYMGPVTISALQRRLGTVVDGYISKPSLVIKELQRRLNEGQL